MLIERPEDMSPDGRLSLSRDSEGDIHVRVIPPMERADDYAPSIDEDCRHRDHSAACVRCYRVLGSLERTGKLGEVYG